MESTCHILVGNLGLKGLCVLPVHSTTPSTVLVTAQNDVSPVDVLHKIKWMTTRARWACCITALNNFARIILYILSKSHASSESQWFKRQNSGHYQLPKLPVASNESLWKMNLRSNYCKDWTYPTLVFAAIALLEDAIVIVVTIIARLSTSPLQWKIKWLRLWADNCTEADDSKRCKYKGE